MQIYRKTRHKVLKLTTVSLHYDMITQLPVNEAHRVNSIQREDNFSTVELSPLLWHIIITHEVNEVTPWHVIHHHVQIFGILESEVKL